MGKKWGYGRVSTIDQNLHMQIDALTNEGCHFIYQEKMTGTTKKRPVLEEMLRDIEDGKISKGDSIVVYKLDRISRNRKDIFELVDIFKEKGINFISIKDKIDTSTPLGEFFFTVMAGVAQLEADIIAERTREGLKAAEARGRKGGRPKSDIKKIDLAIQMYQSRDYSLVEIREMTGVAKPTLYKYLKFRKMNND